MFQQECWQCSYLTKIFYNFISKIFKTAKKSHEPKFRNATAYQPKDYRVARTSIIDFCQRDLASVSAGVTLWHIDELLFYTKCPEFATHLVLVLTPLPDTGHVVSFYKEAKPDRTTKLETSLDGEWPVTTILSALAPMGKRNIHPLMGLPHHSEREGWGVAQGDGTVRLSRALDYIIPTLCEVILGNKHRVQQQHHRSNTATCACTSDHTICQCCQRTGNWNVLPSQIKSCW